MDQQVKSALHGAWAGFCNGNKATGNSDVAVKAWVASLETIFASDKPFLDKVEDMDAAFDEQPAFEALREFTFDLLMINFFASDAQKLEEDYLESQEWEEIEDETIDRGTELLNLFLYLKECKEEDIEPSLEDFLKEFLLVEEDEFQDEHLIYEDIIANELLVDTDMQEMARVSAGIKETSAVKDIFYPFMAFFSDNRYSEELFNSFVKFSENKAHDAALLASLYAYYEGLPVFSKSFLTCLD
jgi:hypothetical protein